MTTIPKEIHINVDPETNTDDDIGMVAEFYRQRAEARWPGAVVTVTTEPSLQGSDPLDEDNNEVEEGWGADAWYAWCRS